MLTGNRKIKVLCLSGGGFRGYYTASVLARMQREFAIRSYAESFDLIIGTSTGALIAAALAVGHSAEEIENRFAEFGPKIFPKNSIPAPFGPFLTTLHRSLRALRFRHQYHRAPLEDVANMLLGSHAQRPLAQLQIPLATVAVSRVSRVHHVYAAQPFASHRDEEVTLLDAVLASAAAPFYFRAYTVKDRHTGRASKSTRTQGSQKRRPLATALTNDVLIDGGLVANAPVLLGALLARRTFGVPLEDVSVLHLDTAGVLQRGDMSQKGWRSWWPFRAATWGLDLVELTMSAQESMQISIANELLNEHYVYLEARKTGPGQARAYALDDASQEALEGLRALARDTWEAWRTDHRLGLFFPPKPFDIERPAFADAATGGPKSTLTSVVPLKVDRSQAKPEK